MKEILAKSFGGLSRQYLTRQLFFGFAMAALFIALGQLAPNGPGGWLFFMFVMNAMLYPYARYVYESCVDFLVGDNSFEIPAAIFLLVKFGTMMACFFFSVFIAPIGLAYLYLRNSR